MQKIETLKTIFTVLICFLLYYLLFINFKTIKVGFDEITHSGIISYILTYIIVGIPIFIGTYIINKKTNILKALGLSMNPLLAIVISILFTLPMFLGGLLFFKFDSAIIIDNLIAGTILAGFMEELYFRGFLFGELFKKTNLGFIPSISLGALIFAFGHLYQSQDPNELIGIFMVTFSGAILFAWLYLEWNYNLWIPIMTHTMMNLSWHLFEIDNSALGDIKANILRGITILVAIIFTVWYKKRKKHKLIINRRTLFMKSQNNV